MSHDIKFVWMQKT